jgi:hypothetical protein
VRVYLSALWRHLPAAVVFAALAVAWTFPLARRTATHLPGAGIGDQVDFVWNFWWMRTAQASGLDFFETSYLFVPAGTDLTLHAHTALPALVGATVFGALSEVAAHNLTLLSALFLNGVCAYSLAWRITRDRAAAIVGGLVFGGSPFIAAHLHGHLNLTMAWVIPLFALAAFAAVRGGRTWALAAGLVLGATVYVDYYYVVYEVALLLCIAAVTRSAWHVGLQGGSRRSLRLSHVVAIFVLLDVVLMAAIVMTGGATGRIGPIRSVRGIFNPLQLFWVLLAVWAWLRFRPRVELPPRHTWAAVMMPLIVVTAVGLAVASPIVWNGAVLLLRGEYVTYRYSWRSSPGGIDMATLLLGNPFHPVWGATVQRAYRALGIGAIESTAWLGVVPVVLAVWALRHSARSSVVRQWSVVGGLFALWAMGPHLMVFGTNSALILPHAVLRYVPIVSNARIPGRAMVVTYLALAVLAAVAASEWRPSGWRRSLVVLAIAAAVVVDYLPAPFPLVAIERPGLYETLRDDPARGAVCELPLGIRDGFSERGMFDDRVLFYQTIHRRPLAGGFVARLPAAVASAYEKDPLLAALLNLSERQGPREGIPLPDRQAAADRLRQNGIAFVVLNRSAASAALVQYVESVLPLTRIAEDETRSLYRVTP